MNNFSKFKTLREEYKEFIFDSYEIKETDKEIIIKYKFEIPNLTTFNPEIKILKKNLKLKKLEGNIIQNMVFHIGLIELISYWKCTCSPEVIIKCGFLNEEQKIWFKKLYFYGLGELFFTNEIKTNIEEFMNITCLGKELNIENEENKNSGYIVPIGGGKDSVVTLETLKIDKENDLCLIVNPKPVTRECAKASGIKDENVVEIYRTIDKNLLELNKKGYINGHTPFSSLLAFLSFFVAYITGKKYIALSNESSANESNVVGEKINHQYSKSYEFENDFAEYTSKYLKSDIKYFSFLRPLNELQIAKIFSKYKKYHKIFKSCNVGSKEKEWKWCGKCPKCLFVYIILSPYLYKEELVEIFGKDLFQDQELLKTFLELTGNGETKPFECVGTFEEVNFALTKTIKNIEKKGETLPYLLDIYKTKYKLCDTTEDITKRFNEENNLTEEQKILLKEAIFSD